jgi:aminoglycoside 3-N-acetyltransferase
MKVTITKNGIIVKLRELGLKSGDNIIAHSSLSSFGYVEGGADTVVDALTELLTAEGTLIMPSFNHGAAYENGGIFDIKTTPTTNGAVAEAFRRRPGVMRSMNPTHSFAAWGKNAERYTAKHHLADSMGEDSPVGMLWKDGGYCLLLGVDYRANTFHHFVETNTGAPCISKRGEVYPVRFADGSEGSAHTWGWREKNCPITDGSRYADFMKPYHRQTKIGGAVVTLYALAYGYKVIEKCLSEGINGFPPCSACSIRPRKTVWTVNK